MFEKMINIINLYKNDNNYTLLMLVLNVQFI